MKKTIIRILLVLLVLYLVVRFTDQFLAMRGLSSAKGTVGIEQVK